MGEGWLKPATFQNILAELPLPLPASLLPNYVWLSATAATHLQNILNKYVN